MGGDDKGHDHLLRTVMTDRPDFSHEEAEQLMGSLLVIAGAPADVGTHVVIEDELSDFDVSKSTRTTPFFSPQC